MQIQYGPEHGRQHRHISNCSLKFDYLCVYLQFPGHWTHLDWMNIYTLSNSYRILITQYITVIFTALHVMQTRYSDENCPSIRPSVCLSVPHTRELWQNGRKICPDFYTIRKIIQPSLLRKRMVGGGDPNGWWGRPLLPEILGQPAPVGAKSPILNR